MSVPLTFSAELTDEQLNEIALLIAPRLVVAAPSPWMTVPEAAEYLRAPTSRIYALASAGTIPLHRDGSRLLFHRHELDAWLRDGGAKRS